MKILHTADWHIGKSIGGFSMLADQRHFFDQFLALLDEERPDAILVAGDVYDRPVPSAEAMGLLDEVLSAIVLEKSIPVLLTAGNHDSRERLSYQSGLLARAGLHIAGTLEDPVRKVVLKDASGVVNFWLLPFVDPAAVNALFPEEERVRDVQSAFDRMTNPIRAALNIEERNVLICHGYFGCTQSGSTEIAETELGGTDLVNLRALAPFDYIAAGHIHQKMQIAENMRYSGSILKYSKNEANHHPSVTWIELGKKGELTLSERSFLPLHDLRTVAGRFDELLQTEHCAFPLDDYLFVTLDDRELVLDAAARLREVFPNLMGMAYQERETVAACFTVSASESRERSVPALFADFYELVAGEELSAVEEQIVAATADACAEKGDAL